MEYKVVWVPLAVETYMEEIDFIYLKWLSRDFKTRINWLYYPASALLFPFFIGYISFLYLIRFPFDWKGR